ncbi:hypothetical protein RSJ42_07055 [Methanosarcina hadiensis]|uniref:hypothetical protein n=1 Tax=Methanosarcina hadiensis TaxID=3078083 RepID=UPI003977BEEB
MKKDKFPGPLNKNSKLATCIELISVSKIFSFSKLMQNKPILKGIEPKITENKAPETKTHKKENSENVRPKTSVYSLPTQVRIRATDREGNTIEVTY